MLYSTNKYMHVSENSILIVYVVDVLIFSKNNFGMTPLFNYSLILNRNLN